MREPHRRDVVKWLAYLALLGACGEQAGPGAALPNVQPDAAGRSRFRHVYSDPTLRAGFLLFLTNVFHLMPEHALHREIAEAARELATDREIYQRIRERAADIAPMLAGLRYGLPALAKQKAEMAGETAKLVKDRVRAERYVEIGTPGRYVKALRGHMNLGQEVYLVHTSEPSMSPEDIAERGGPFDVGAYVPLDGYAPLSGTIIPEGKIDLVTNYIGLHHAPRAKLDAFVDSIHGVLRPGGVFVLRDHDVKNHDQDDFVALAHDVFNAGLGLDWAYNAAELRFFQSIDAIESYLAKRGFRRVGPRLAQPGDPTQNLLLAFERV